jgi:hypothetical protein
LEITNAAYALEDRKLFGKMFVSQLTKILLLQQVTPAYSKLPMAVKPGSTNKAVSLLI